MTLSRANLFRASLSATAGASSFSTGGSGIGRGSSSAFFGSSYITSGSTFSLTVTANRNWSNHVSKLHGRSEFAEAQNTGIPVSVLLS